MPNTRIIVAMFLMLLLPKIGAYALPFNYENSEDLSAANQIAEMDARDMTVHHRDLMVEKYESYLDKNPGTVNRADVLAKIGLIYNYTENATQGLRVDKRKAEEYLRRAIAIDPDYVSRETTLARTNLCSRGSTRLEKVWNFVDCYKWAHDVTDEQMSKSFRKHVLLRPVRRFDMATRQTASTVIGNDAELRSEFADVIGKKIEGEKKKTRKGLDVVMESALYNAIAGAYSTDDPLGTLDKMAEALRGYPGEIQVLEAIERYQQANQE